MIEAWFPVLKQFQIIEYNKGKHYGVRSSYINVSYILAKLEGEPYSKEVADQGRGEFNVHRAGKFREVTCMTSARGKVVKMQKHKTK